MKYLIYLLLILYVISPFDLLPEFFVGPIGVIEDVITVGVLYWYFIYRRARIRVKSGKAYYQEGEGRGAESYQENQKRAQTETRFSKLDPHKFLGVPREASLEEIKIAYRKLASK